MRRFRWLLLMVVFSLVFCLACASDEEKIQRYLTSGDNYFAQEEYRSAEIEFKNAIQINPNLVEAHLKLGETYLKLGNARGAFIEFSTAAKIAPDNLDTQLKLATFLFLGQQLAPAREKVDLVLAAEPENVEALLLRAGLDEREERFDEALATYEKVRRIDNQRVGAYLGAARVQLRAGRPEAAEAIEQRIWVEWSKSGSPTSR